MKKILIRSLLVCFLGIIISIAIFMTFLKSETNADILQIKLIVLFYLLVLSISLISESIFYYFFSEKKAFIFSYVVVVLFITQAYLRADDKSDYQYIILTPIFLIINFVSFKMIKQKKLRQ